MNESAAPVPAPAQGTALQQTLRDFVRDLQQRKPSRSQAAALGQTLETMRRELPFDPRAELEPGPP